MGQFTDNIRRRANGGKERVSPIKVSTSRYFLKVKKAWYKFWVKPKFIHYVSANRGMEEYKAKEGIYGACVFTFDAAKTFIRETNAANLVLVRTNKVIVQ